MCYILSKYDIMNHNTVTSYCNFVASRCKDQRPDCPTLTATGYCEKQRSTMERLCPRSCRVCPGQSRTSQIVPTVADTGINIYSNLTSRLTKHFK